MDDFSKRTKKVSESPTRPGAKKNTSKFDVRDIFAGPLSNTTTDSIVSESSISLDEKLRKAYYWMVNQAIISPFYDIEFNDGPLTRFSFGDLKTKLSLPSDYSYSSFVLLPLLNLITRRRCLIVGGPGRGKTASAILMGILAGYPLKEIRRAIQHGQPQMTISDLLGNPIPSDLMNAKSMDDIKISWRKWLGMRVKIIDEYNRIPTRTQSALLTVMGDNYAEILDQIYECPDSAWYLTANDDAGGGTYQVIEALKDRIDIVVKALHFNSRFIGDLLKRVELGTKVEETVPSEIIFTEEEINLMNKEILNIEFPAPLLRRIEFFSSHFEFYEPASEQIEYKTKDTVKLSSIDFKSLDSLETGKDSTKDLGSQTRNGLSVRSIMTALVFIKALAYFRGESKVSSEDIRQILPFVLHDKLVQNSDASFFQVPEHSVYRVDKVSWIRKLYDLSCSEFDRLSFDDKDPILELEKKFSKGLDGVSLQEAETEIQKINQLLTTWSAGRKLYGHLYDDILKLKYLHQRYTSYIKWLKAR
jgi:MoxR-like ATPase